MYLDKRRTSTISTILYINERNRKLNVKEAENAIRAEREALGGVRQSDPFTRRQTRPTMVTKDVKTNDLTAEQIKELEDEKKMKAEKENRKKEEEARKKKMTEEKSREEERKRLQEEDPYATHDFDLNIDFAHSMPPVVTPTGPIRGANGSSFNGSLVQATPKRSLNLEEYKKKKGLL